MPVDLHSIAPLRMSGRAARELFRGTWVLADDVFVADDVLPLENGRVAYNRSAPPVSVTPVLTYPNVTEAVAWLVRVFGFDERVRIGDHRAQLSFGNGALIVADDSGDRRSVTGTGVTHSVMVRVDEIDKHYAEVQAAGVTTLGEPADMPYGERQYSVADPAGHRWTFTQSVMDVVPEDWGGQTIQPW